MVGSQAALTDKAVSVFVAKGVKQVILASIDNRPRWNNFVRLACNYPHVEFGFFPNWWKSNRWKMPLPGFNFSSPTPTGVRVIFGRKPPSRTTTGMRTIFGVLAQQPAAVTLFGFDFYQPEQPHDGFSFPGYYQARDGVNEKVMGPSIYHDHLAEMKIVAHLLVAFPNFFIDSHIARNLARHNFSIPSSQVVN